MTMQAMQAINQANVSRREAIRRALRRQRRVTSFTPYFSRVTFQTVRTGSSGAGYTYTIPAGTVVRAFGYGLGGDMSAGGNTGVIATNCDTNITNPQRTIGGVAVAVSGISLQVLPDTIDYGLVGQLWPRCSVRLSLNGGEQSLVLGTPTMLPGASGLYGSGSFATGVQALPGGRPLFGFVSNGLPGMDNQTAIPEGFIWMPEGEADSNLTINIVCERDAAITSGPDVAATSGVAAYTNPTAAQMFVNIQVRLHGAVIGPRSMVV